MQLQHGLCLQVKCYLIAETSNYQFPVNRGIVYSRWINKGGSIGSYHNQIHHVPWQNIVQHWCFVQAMITLSHMLMSREAEELHKVVDSSLVGTYFKSNRCTLALNPRDSIQHVIR